MKVEQVYQIANDVVSQYLGMESSDTDNYNYDMLIDKGREIMGTDDIENFTRKLIDHIGKVLFDNRRYGATGPEIYMDAWEYGSILEKIRTKMPEAIENPSWKLENGKSYDPNVFVQPEASATFFNSKTTFEIDMSFAELQVKSAFDSMTQLNSFFSMIETSVSNAMDLRFDQLKMQTITQYMLYLEANSTNHQKVQLLSMYKAQFPSASTLTPEAAITDPEFIRFATYQILMYKQRLQTMGHMFNMESYVTFTPRENLKMVFLTPFVAAADVYLQSDTFHNEFVALPQVSQVPFWVGPSSSEAEKPDWSLKPVSSMGGIIPSESEPAGEGTYLYYVIGCMFDKYALGVTNMDRRIKTNYNPKAEFYTNFYKFDAGYFNDFNENFIYFTLT